MLRYKTQTRPSLVGLYDIWPGNGAGQFLQPRSPHGAHKIASISNQRLTILCRKNCQQRARFVTYLTSMQVFDTLQNTYTCKGCIMTLSSFTALQANS